MYYNNKYIGIESVLTNITSLYSKLNVTKHGIIEWVMDCEINHIANMSEWTLFVDISLEVDQKKALLPCNVYKLLEVRDGGEMIKYFYNGTYLFLDKNYTDLTITYRGLTVLEDGTPLILRGHEVACARFCIVNLFEEDYVSGKLDGQRFGYLNQKWYEERDKAISSMRNLTRNDIRDMLMINANMKPVLGHIPKYNLD